METKYRYREPHPFNPNCAGCIAEKWLAETPFFNHVGVVEDDDIYEVRVNGKIIATCLDKVKDV